MSVDTLPLQEVAEVKLGRQRSPKHHQGDQMRPYVRAANVSWSGWKLDDVKSMNFTDAEMEVYRLQAGDLLLNEASGSATEVGKPAIWRGEIDECAFQNTLIRVRPRTADSNYLLHYFSYCAATGAFARSSRGVGIHHLGRKALAEWQVPLPPIEEQRRIAALLDEANELRETRRLTVVKLSTLVQSVFAEMFSGGDSVRTTLGELTEEFRYGTSSKSSTGGIPALRIPNIVGGDVSYDDIKRVPTSEDELDRLRLRSGDLLFVRSNGNPDFVGRCAAFSQEHATRAGFDEPIIYASYLIRARLDLDRVTPAYAVTYLNGIEGRRAMRAQCRTSAGQYNLNTKGLGSIEIGLPPIDLQLSFERKLRRIEQQLMTARLQLSSLDTLVGSLRQRAFRGDL